jgi:hypothetical protein
VVVGVQIRELDPVNGLEDDRLSKHGWNATNLIPPPDAPKTRPRYQGKRQSGPN